MSMEDKPIGKLFDIVLNVRWQDLLEVWRVLKKKMDTEGKETMKEAFSESKERLMGGSLSDHVDVRWGMDLCPHCNDSNKETNGIAYQEASGDGLEFNQCLNCRIGLLYDVVAAKAKLNKYVIALGKPGQFAGISFYWNAVVPDSMTKFLPMYDIIHKGQWLGTVSFDDDMTPKYLPFDAMKSGTPRGSEDVWTDEFPGDLKSAIDKFVEDAHEHLEVALAIV